MKVLLVSYSGKPLHPDNFIPDNGLAQLAGCVREAGHECVVHYLNTPRLLWELNSHAKVEADLMHKVRQVHPDVIGFKLYINGFYDSLKLAEAVKTQFPGIKLLAGGPQITYFEEKIFLVTREFDVLTTGEGERAITGILEALEGKRELSTVPNIIYLEHGVPRKTGRIYSEQLGELPDPAWDVYDKQFRDLWPIMVFTISRGCSVKCAFCTHPYIWGDRFRSRPMDAIMREVAGAKAQYGFRHFRLADSTPVPGMLERFSQAIIDKSLDIRWSGYAYARMINPSVLRLMKTAGCIFLWYGLESANEAILTSMNKKIVAGNMMEAARMTREAGITYLTSLIVGFPGETEESIEETFAFVKQMRPDSVQVTALGLVPQTPLARDPEKYGITAEANWELSLMNMRFAGMDEASTKGKGYYTSGGKPWEYWQEKATELVRRFDGENLLTQTTDDLHLMADVAGMEIREFRQRVQGCMQSGDQAGMERLIRQSWKNATAA